MTAETVPDDTELIVNTTFTKTWTLKNVGSCTWTSGYHVIFDNGDAMGGPASIPITAGTVAPGESVVVSVDLVVPGAIGTYRGNWRIKSPEGEIFSLTTGNPFWVQIKAVSGGVAMTLSPHIPSGPIFLMPKIDMVYEGASVPASNWASAKATCPSGSIVVGGGFAGSHELVIYTTYKDGNGWTTYGWNTSGSSRLLNSYAVCLSNTSGSTSQKAASTNVGAGSIGHLVVSCPAGSVVTGGGWASNKDFWVL